MPLGWVADNFFAIRRQIARMMGNGSIESRFKIGCRGGKLVQILTCEQKVNQLPHEYNHIMLMQGERFLDDPAVTKLLVINRSIAIHHEMESQLEEINLAPQWGHLNRVP